MILQLQWTLVVSGRIRRTFFVGRWSGERLVVDEDAVVQDGDASRTKQLAAAESRAVKTMS